ncbi:hypothetical protein KQX54_006264 [Cotesia glomerata]|uniref:Uncharacterized protein n=1 Tax=Cotesia glomerata TaxID=32391 RepID=A0AAV7J5P6_COTGL|nr:hypothetical protein KQX54_006264 [Cotesia glomerata]
MAVYGKQSSAERKFLRDFVKLRRKQILEDARSNQNLQHTIARGTENVAKVTSILANNPDIDFENFTRGEAQKIAKLFYNVKSLDDRKIGYIYTLVNSKYDEIEANLQGMDRTEEQVQNETINQFDAQDEVNAMEKRSVRQESVQRTVPSKKRRNSLDIIVEENKEYVRTTRLRKRRKEK